MRSQHIPITWEAFELMPRRLGWKYEYCDGQVHLSPRHQVVTVTLAVGPHVMRAPCDLRPVRDTDREQLVSTYVAAFADTVEFCDWESAAIVAAARKDVLGFFASTRGQPLLASRVAVAAHSHGGAEQLVGAALLVKTESDGPLLDMLFVAPAAQRKGIATALLAATMTELDSRGIRTLRSRYHLGNEASRAWHQRCGFVEEPNLLVA